MVGDTHGGAALPFPRQLVVLFFDVKSVVGPRQRQQSAVRASLFLRDGQADRRSTSGGVPELARRAGAARDAVVVEDGEQGERTRGVMRQEGLDSGQQLGRAISRYNIYYGSD